MVYRFGECILDTQQHRLERAGQPVRLRSKAFQVLCYLLEHQDRTVLKSELYAQVWPQSFISEATLESTLRTVRQAIGDSGRAQQLIQTVYGYGYRFIAAVEVCADPPPSAAGEAGPSSPGSVLVPPTDDDLHAVPVRPTPGPAAGHDGRHMTSIEDERTPTGQKVAADLSPERPAVPSPVWEQKPVAVLAVEFTFPTATEGEAAASEPWRAASRWEQALVAQVRGFGGVVLQRSPSLLLVAFGVPQTLDQLPQRAVQAALTLRQLVREGTEGEPCPELRLTVHWGPLLVDVQTSDRSALTPLKQLLIERTQGNPFFLEESIRTLVEMKSLVGGPGAYRLTQVLPTIKVPATIQAVLAARIDRLPAEEKSLLQTAAVIGTEVPLPLLRAVAALSEEGLRMGLAHLQGAEFLYETRLFPELAYTFKHALTQEVAYGSLLQEHRRVLHAGIVSAIETLYDERLAEQVERLAYHAFRGEMWEKAVAYCRQAGIKAAARSAHRAAVVCFEQALMALRQLAESRETLQQAIDLRFDLRASLLPLGEFWRMLDYLREAEILAEALNDRGRLGWISAYLMNYFVVMGDHDRAIASAQHALALATALGDVALQVHAHQRLGRVYFNLGDYCQATDVLKRNVASLEGKLLWEHFGEVNPPSVQSRGWLVRCLAERGEFAEGIACAEEAVRLAEAVNRPFGLIQICEGVGSLYLRAGDFHKAIPLLERGLAVCKDADVQILLPTSASTLGYAYALTGRVAAALPLLEQAMELATSTRQVAQPSLILARLSEGYLLAGHIDAANDLVGQALALSHDRKERGNEAWALRLRGEIAAPSDPPKLERADDYYRQALALADELGMRPLLAHCRRGLGTLYAKVGRPEQARPELTTAIELYRSMEMTFWLPQAEAALAQLGG
jgi:DNA-binding winged helix-turn-helix (wHTH) protein/tetratricopeptide (TPR) repeat protein